jgi:hypothetical protein
MVGRAVGFILRLKAWVFSSLFIILAATLDFVSRTPSIRLTTSSTYLIPPQFDNTHSGSGGWISKGSERRIDRYGSTNNSLVKSVKSTITFTMFGGIDVQVLLVIPGLLVSLLGGAMVGKPRRVARFQEQIDAIGSNRYLEAVEPAEWNVMLNRLADVCIFITGIYATLGGFGIVPI